MRGMILVAAGLLCAIGSGATAAPVSGQSGEDSGISRLRAQNDALRERMGQMQLDLLIADVLSARDPKPMRVTRADGPVPQVVAFRK